ncbi:MAG: MBL fold metallo-hydrolase [Desulfobacterales bacterium]|nr:MBL fold metallo-hydrolase [Desulfobacterales bacterium]
MTEELNQINAFIWQSTQVNNCNSYLIDGPTKILIDPGHAELFQHVSDGLKGLNINIDDIGLIICTHIHPDHVEAVQLFKDKKTLIAFHHEEWELATSMSQYMQSFGIDISLFSPDFFLKEGDINVNGVKLQIIHTPGHSPGSISIYWPEQKVLFSGDTVFQDAVGRVDLPGGNGQMLKESIKKISELKLDWIFPGHGDIIQGNHEIKANFDHIKNFYFNYL